MNPPRAPRTAIIRKTTREREASLPRRAAASLVPKTINPPGRTRRLTRSRELRKLSYVGWRGGTSLTATSATGGPRLGRAALGGPKGVRREGKQQNNRQDQVPRMGTEPPERDPRDKDQRGHHEELRGEGRDSLDEVAVTAAVEGVDHQAQGQPSQEAPPGDRRKAPHQPDARRDPGQGELGLDEPRHLPPAQ